MEIDLYRERRRNSLAEETLQNRIYMLKRVENLLPHNGEPNLEDLQYVFDVLNEELSAGTAKQYLSAVKDYFAMIHPSTKYNFESIAKRLEPYTHASKKEVALTRQEVQDMIEAPKKTRDKFLMAVLYSYSRRLGEALMLNRNHINLRDKTIKFKFEKKGIPYEELINLPFSEVPDKAKDTYTLYPSVEKYARSYLEKRKDGCEAVFVTVYAGEVKRMTRQTGINIVNRAKEKAGVDKEVSSHAFRRARATHLRAEGVPTKIIQERLLHHALESTTRDTYTRSFEKEKKEIVPPSL